VERRHGGADERGRARWSRPHARARTQRRGRARRSRPHGRARTRRRGRARAGAAERPQASTAERGHGGADERGRARAGATEQAARPSANMAARTSAAERGPHDRAGHDGVDEQCRRAWARTVREGAGRAAERGQAGPAWAQRRGRVPASAGGPPSIETGGFFTATFSSFLRTSLRAWTPFPSEETVSLNFILFLH
jgi:hypothetical protein